MKQRGLTEKNKILEVLCFTHFGFATYCLPNTNNLI